MHWINTKSLWTKWLLGVVALFVVVDVVTIYSFFPDTLHMPFEILFVNGFLYWFTPNQIEDISFRIVDWPFLWKLHRGGIELVEMSAFVVCAVPLAIVLAKGLDAVRQRRGLRTSILAYFALTLAIDAIVLLIRGIA